MRRRGGALRGWLGRDMAVICAHSVAPSGPFLFRIFAGKVLWAAVHSAEGSEDEKGHYEEGQGADDGCNALGWLLVW